MSRIRILLADDHALVRSGIVKLLEGDEDFLIVGEASDGEEAIEKTRKLHPDIVIIDIAMPKLSGIEAAKIIQKKYPSTKILVLTMHENEEYVYQIFKSGASGYVLKNAKGDELSTAIRAVANGERYFSSGVSDVMIRGYLRRVQGRDAPVPGDDVPLTKREKEILKYIAQGMNNLHIGDRLFISPRTVETHRTNIMQKLDIHDAPNLVRYAIEHGFGSEAQPV